MFMIQVREFNNDRELRGNEGETYENIDIRAVTTEVGRLETIPLHFQASTLRYSISLYF